MVRHGTKDRYVVSLFKLMLSICWLAASSPTCVWADEPKAVESNFQDGSAQLESTQDISSDLQSSDQEVRHRTEGDQPKLHHLRILSYNIHHGRGMDGRVDLKRVADVISACSPDLVALQEVDQRVNRSGKVSQIGELSELTGLNGVFAKQIDYDGGEYGQAILSRWPISDLKVIWLPGEPDRERRILAVAKIQLASNPMMFATTHLHHNNPSIRLEQAIAINRELGSSSLPVILGGDLNAEPSSPTLTEISRAWTVIGSANQLKTFPSEQPDKQLDYICYRPQDAFRVVSSKVIAEPIASDHRPVLGILELFSVPAR
jgi:endonuclease/exonuclease/phosphatase family metal-dependent hydrolase